MEREMDVAFEVRPNVGESVVVTNTKGTETALEKALSEALETKVRNAIINTGVKYENGQLNKNEASMCLDVIYECVSGVISLGLDAQLQELQQEILNS